MKSTPFISFLSFLIALSLSGCKNTVTQPDLVGNMVGFVITFDEFGDVLDNPENVVVTANERFFTLPNIPTNVLPYPGL